MGFLAQRIKLLDNGNIENFSLIMTRFILPCMLLTVIGSGGTRAELLGMWKYLLSTIVVLLTAVGIGFILSRMIGLKQPTKNMHILVTSFGNGGFIGIPVISAMFPEGSGLAIAIFSLVEATICWTIGPLLTDTTSDSKKIDYRTLVTPTTISIVLGIVIILLNLDFNGNVVWETVKNVGATTKYFAAIYIGLDLGRKGLKKMIEKPKVFIAAPFKLIIFPVLTYIILGGLGILSGESLIILTLFTATPTGMAVPLIARMGKSDEAYATAGTMLCTILCLFTMPFVMWLVSHF